MIVTACCNPTSTLAGGSGCTACRHIPTSSKDSLVKVNQPFLYCILIFVLILYSALGRSEITCAPIEYVTIQPPLGQTCQQYLGQFINNFGGYITNPDAASSCQFCSYRTTDEFLQSNSNIFYSHHWRNLGLVFVYVGFNVSQLFGLSVCLRPTNIDFARVGIRSLCYDIHLPYSRTYSPFLSQALVNEIAVTFTITYIS